MKVKSQRIFATSLVLVVGAVLLAIIVLTRNGGIHDAAEEGNLEEVKSILAKKPELVNAKDSAGFAPLHIAAWEGHKNIVELLLDKGADVDVKTTYGDTALHSVVLIVEKSIIQLLLANGADVNATDKEGMTALDWALPGDTVKLLRKGGATEYVDGK